MDASRAYHDEQCAVAVRAFMEGRDATHDQAAWRDALAEARHRVFQTLRKTEYLRDIPGALKRDGATMAVLRYMMAPPLSQDQFALVCGGWRKGSEGPRSSPLPQDVAERAADEFARRVSPHLSRWLTGGGKHLRDGIEKTVWYVGALMAAQAIQTTSRMQASTGQETELVALLRDAGWTQLPAKLLDRRASLPSRQFMHKTRFTTATATGQEVDVALGLANDMVLALECKVSNDQTNSVKRVNDILKKANVWKEHWGNFVQTGALLRGVFSTRDVTRLLDAKVVVFWSHDLAYAREWLWHRV